MDIVIEDQVQATITNIVERLKQVTGVKALVLGGSRARGTHTPTSDIDIGIYYNSSNDFDISSLLKAAADIDDTHRVNLVTEIGGWGPWINGGGWLTINNYAVDILYRDVNKVGIIMEQCLTGNVTIDIQPGHPHGFINSIYLAEIALCQVLWDPSGIIKALKERTIHYPPLLKNALIDKFMWEASFALEIGKKGISRMDLSYIAGCCFRSISCLNLVLFAINECYWMNEKGAVAIANTFPNAPIHFSSRVNEIINLITDHGDHLEKCLQQLQELVRETEKLIME